MITSTWDFFLEIVLDLQTIKLSLSGFALKISVKF